MYVFVEFSSSSSSVSIRQQKIETVNWIFACKNQPKWWTWAWEHDNVQCFSSFYFACNFFVVVCLRSQIPILKIHHAHNHNDDNYMVNHHRRQSQFKMKKRKSFIVIFEESFALYKLNCITVIIMKMNDQKSIQLTCLRSLCVNFEMKKIKIVHFSIFT